MHKYKVGQIIKFDEDGLYGFGVIVKVRSSISSSIGGSLREYLVKLLGDLSNKGHDGAGFDGNYYSKEYWWVYEYNIKYVIDGNKIT